MGGMGVNRKAVELMQKQGRIPKVGDDPKLFKHYQESQKAKTASQKPEPKVGIAKVRKEPLKNVPDKKIIHRRKDYRSRITSWVQTSGITKRPKASRAN